MVEYKKKKVRKKEKITKASSALENSRIKKEKVPKKKQKYASFWTSIIPLNKDDKIKLGLVQEVFEHEELKALKYLLKTHKARFEQADFDTNRGFLQDPKYLSLACNVIDEEIKKKVGELNQKLVGHEKEKVFENFAHTAEEKILGLIAPNIIGMEEVKKAGLYQLFAREKVHILLLGDPATGKTDILRSISELTPISSFGLGSGASKAGLTLTVSGKEVVKGLLPLADKGVACIDELNLLRNVDRAGLLNAMEKGFVTYDKANTHVKLDANVNVFASANPEGDRFVGKTTSILKKQVPFDSALLSRFHLVFLIRKPSTEEFLKITDKIIKGEKAGVHENDTQFVKEYVGYALKKNVAFDKELSPLIQGFIEDVKKDENQFLVEISPRIVIGIMNMAKAAARMRLKEKVEREDIIKALKIFNSALYIKKDEKEK
ncbi:hypothetical protein AYK26_07095 [Euryarchaeota archaeon SM23-78]|nr:MAG: hypothetical protein AYK26_07095 [Euryarchaeota archaeon SM23-78]MBW3000776.1 hypothetical protein [Candidatus Woesearchaeota archaeon]